MTLAEHRANISRLAFMDEAEAVNQMMFTLKPMMQGLEAGIHEQSAQWLHTIRDNKETFGVEQFLHTYGLDTSEGVALMCLAEALLRIPDSTTADELIRDTFEGRNWERYTHQDGSWLIHMSSWGLLLSGKLIDFGHDDKQGTLSAIKGLVARVGEPVLREALKKAMGIIGGQFVLGETTQEALKNSRKPQEKGHRFSYDILGEGARSDSKAQEYVASYLDGIAHIAASVSPNTSLFEAPGISVKLSALHPRYQLTQEKRVMDELIPRLKTILLAAKKAGIAVSIDAEESSRLDIELMVFESVFSDPDFTGYNGIGFVLQAYQKRAYYVIDWLSELAKKYKRLIPLRLVKGAYWDSEIKWAQVAGLESYPVFTRKEHTDISYLACANKILMQHSVFFPQFATHNVRSAASILSLAAHYQWPRSSFEFQRLHGMGETLHNLLLSHAPSRIYAPIGAHKDLLAYLIRRLLENGANSSFVHMMMDTKLSDNQVLADPLLICGQQTSSTLPLPSQIYDGQRQNSCGVDFGNLIQRDALCASVICKPVAAFAESTDMDAMVVACAGGAKEWRSFGVSVRADILDRAGQMIEDARDELIALLISEAGKTLADGIAEVRETVDYCRYYASEARRLLNAQPLSNPAGESNTLRLCPRGVFLCISPWNFPLAIFTGQIVAALVAGNGVIAKPAEQTPAIANYVVELLYNAGITRDALQLAFGRGETIGAALVAHPCVQGVVFTGSVETAQHIRSAIAARPGSLIPLIAETGGQNCMVVDSSALPEQAVDDIITSAFGSAGQRCSSLRVLYVQEDIADELLVLLAGAMQELHVGNPLLMETDIGPLIDSEAKSMVESHITFMKKNAKLVAATPLPAGISGNFVAPHAFEISDINVLRREIFGPVLHVLRFKAGTLEQMANDINSTGYGLTFGIHSRIEAHIELLLSRVHAGNIYVNRSMTGAVVGVQPFGGEGLSGTGPKAGGPYYLSRFCVERTLTINTTAIGGNTTLLTR